MNYAVVLAGGAGSRFWPVSRESIPKQFLAIYSDRTLIEETIQRISPLIKKKNIYIATNRIHSRKIKDCLKAFDIPRGNFFFEPAGRNTLAPIAFFSAKIKGIHPQAVIAVMPSDHFIKNNRKYLRSLSRAIHLAQKGFIVTIGIRPSRPETGYGYIKAKIGTGAKARGFFKVDKFIEKPTLAKAKKLVSDKNYFWNSGTFIFRADVMLEEIRKFSPVVYKAIMKMHSPKDINRLWRRLPSVSIDYAVMEKTGKAVLLPCDYGWLDLGHWKAMEELLRKDKEGNIFIGGKCIDVGSRSSLVWSDNRLVATIGLNNMIVVDTEDALLVCSKDKAQDVKKVVQLLKAKKLKKYI
ncbi:MAG: mannose-1-phosphate guanylyltransferase [Candidatus Omnitrophica bacterium]|nr:mannose-1-phosphate guanylyltransferase [Candidatus Omnitrophota bacterium]